MDDNADYFLKGDSINEEEINKKYEEFFDLLNEYYLKISIISDNELYFQCYNTKLLDNIEYNKKFPINKFRDIYPYLNRFSNLEDLLNHIALLIDNKKYNIEKKGENLKLTLKNEDKNNMILIFNNMVKNKDEYLQILSKEIIEIRKQKEKIEKIKQDNIEIFNKIEELKKAFN